MLLFDTGFPDWPGRFVAAGSQLVAHRSLRQTFELAFFCLCGTIPVDNDPFLFCPEPYARLSPHRSPDLS